MPKLAVHYTKPDDTAGFDEHYRSVHRPLALAVPGATWETIRWTSTPRGGEPAFYLSAVATFADDAALQEALHSPEMMAASRDAAQMVGQFGNSAEMLLGTEDEAGGPGLT
jgi:uncharacterized protein (TIGR02118 family)